MKKFILLYFGVLAFILGGLVFFKSSPALAAFNQNNLMSDSIFENSSAMSASSIDSFLNSFPSSCISSNNGFTTPDPQGWNTNTNSYSFGGNVTAGKAIYDAAANYHLNPQVLLATLQKEQSLVSGSAGCHPNTPDPSSATPMTNQCGSGTRNCTLACPYSGGCMTIAVGYGCPSYCDSQYEGFSKQIIWAAWVFRFAQERSQGIFGYPGQDPGDENITYTGPTPAGCIQRVSGGPSVCSDGTYTLADGTNVTISSGATASLYRYTPFISGNQSFVSIFESWFGPTTSLINYLTMRNISQPDTTPALGQTVTYTFSLTNTLSNSLTLSAVGVVGRLGDVNGANRDFGWQGPVTLSSGQTQQFTFSTIIKDTGTLYAWPAVYYQNSYTHYNNWGAALSIHLPNLSLSTPFSSTITNPIAGQTATLSATIKNNEDQPIQLDSLGIPVRFYGTYNYDTGWSMSPVTIQPGASQAVSGNLLFDKPGPYTAWASAEIGSQFITLSPVLSFNATKPVPNFQLTYLATPDLTPALGEDVSVQFKLKNNSGVPMTLDSVGVVGRYDNPYTGANNDFGWVGPESFAVGEEKSYTAFTSNISDLRNFYAWVAINYQGSYTHYNNWGFLMTPHIPNLTTSVPVTVNSGSPPSLNQPTPVTVTIQNNETHAIKYSAAGIPARYYGTYNYDAVWQGAGSLAAGATLKLDGTIDFDKHGPYTLWASILIQGHYITIGSQKNLNL